MPRYDFPQVPPIEDGGGGETIDFEFNWGDAPDFSEIKSIFYTSQFVNAFAFFTGVRPISFPDIHNTPEKLRKISAHFKKAKEYFEGLAEFRSIDISSFSWSPAPDFNSIASKSESLADKVAELLLEYPRNNVIKSDFVNDYTTLATTDFKNYLQSLVDHILRSKEYFSQFNIEG